MVRRYKLIWEQGQLYVAISRLEIHLLSACPNLPTVEGCACSNLSLTSRRVVAVAHRAQAERETPFLQQIVAAAQAAAKKSPSRFCDKSEGYRPCCAVFPYPCSHVNRPLFLVGHSFGARAAVHLMCRKARDRFAWQQRVSVSMCF